MGIKQAFRGIVLATPFFAVAADLPGMVRSCIAGEGDILVYVSADLGLSASIAGFILSATTTHEEEN